MKKHLGEQTPKFENLVSMPPIASPRSEITLETLAKEIIARGNDMEVRSSKDGIKVFEVRKKLVATIPSS